MYSIFDLFKVGVGPSSSHTVGPMIAAYRFAQSCLDGISKFGDNNPSISRVQIELFGSLALTGVGHATDVAILAGLSGCLPNKTSPDEIQAIVQNVRESKRLVLSNRLEITFQEKSDLVWLFHETLPQHPNAMRFKAYSDSTELLFDDQYFSTGGGFVYSLAEFQFQFDGGSSPASMDELSGVPYPFTCAKDLIEICRTEHFAIEELIDRNEMSRLTMAQIDARLDELWDVMSACIEKGCRSSGLLPGSLRVPRRAPEIFRKLSRSTQSPSESGMISQPARPRISLLTMATQATPTDPLEQLDWVSLFALAVNEENAAGGRVVTAPTNGAAGIIPAVLGYYVYFYPGADQQGVYRFLKTAGAIGLLYKRNASLSAAEMGCQGEVGVACSMAAAGLAACMNGTVEQIENAAEIGMEHNLGLTCDPIGGLVQVPCIERNTMGATKAINAARLAVLYGDGKHFVSLDRVIETMRQTGVDMQVKYKETSLGGLAVNVVDC
jgi:L-serine dehydratase